MPKIELQGSSPQIRPDVDQTTLHFTSLHPNFPPHSSSITPHSQSPSLPLHRPQTFFLTFTNSSPFYNQPPTPSQPDPLLPLSQQSHPLLSTSRSNRSLTLTPLPQTNKQTNKQLYKIKSHHPARMQWGPEADAKVRSSSASFFSDTRFYLGAAGVGVGRGRGGGKRHPLAFRPVPDGLRWMRRGGGVCMVALTFYSASSSCMC